MTSFTHLRAHTEYSIKDSTLRIADYVDMAKKDGMPAIAMTDLSGMFGAVRFYKECRSGGVKPIIGADVWVENPADSKDPHRVLLLCENLKGYRNLMELMSKAFLSNQKAEKAQFKKEWIDEASREGLICLSGDEASGEIGRLLVAGDTDGAERAAREWEALFPGRFFMEVQRRGAPNETAFVDGAVKIAQATGIPLVATHPIQFPDREGFVAHEVRTCDQTKDVLPDRQRPRLFTPEQHFKTQGEMEEIFSDIPEALSNSVSIAKMCNVEIPLGFNHLPDFPTPDGSPLGAYFRKMSAEGMEARLVELFPSAAERDAKRPAYQARLDTEMDTIVEMGFPGYFMIVADFIGWAKAHDVPVGPGRGSGAGSLVAYSLQITDLDPLKHDLLFERFLNPERVSMPDFDIDFCPEKRELVIDYVKNKYGHAAVGQISTFGTMASKAAVKTAGRVLGLNFNFVDGISKLIPSKPGLEITIPDAIEMVDELRAKNDSEPEVRKLLDMATRIEGLPKSIGRHAGGVIIAPGKITDYSPLYVPEDSTDVVSQYDKDDVEKAGLVKFDFLGVSMLTVLDRAVGFIRQREGFENFKLTAIPMDDKAAYDIYSNGNSFGLFQMQEDGIRQYAVRMGISNIEELTDLLALYRPGPLQSGMVEDYIARKKGEQEVSYPHPLLEPVLNSTKGVIVYQEQVMLAARVLSGYSLGGADILRRAMGKKKPEEMAKQRSVFVDGAAKNGVDPKTAEDIFSLIEKFAEYGFNKSHSAAYAYLSYYSAYLKANHPAEFFAASMTTESLQAADTDKIALLVKDAKRNGVEVLPPDVNESTSVFIPNRSASAVRYGFAAVKGVGKNAAELITLDRDEGGPFTGLVDFCVRMAKRTVNRRTVDQLIKAGALDSICERATAVSNLDSVMEYAQKLYKKEIASAGVLDELPGFSLDGNAPKKKSTRKPPAPLLAPEIIPAEPLPLLERLAHEKQSLGFYFAEHPFTHYKNALGGLAPCESFGQLDASSPGWDQHWVAGFVNDIRVIPTKAGSKMAIVTISDDNDAQREVKMFSAVYEQTKEWLKPDQFALFAVNVKEDSYRGGVQFNVADVKSFSETKALLADNLNIAAPIGDLPKILDIASRYQGEVPLLVWHPNGDGYVRAREHVLKVAIDERMLDEMKREFGDKHVKIRFKQSLPPSQTDNRSKWKKKAGGR